MDISKINKLKLIYYILFKKQKWLSLLNEQKKHYHNLEKDLSEKIHLIQSDSNHMITKSKLNQIAISTMTTKSDSNYYEIDVNKHNVNTISCSYVNYNNDYVDSIKNELSLKLSKHLIDNGFIFSQINQDKITFYIKTI